MMLDPVKDIFTVAGLRALITKIVGGLSSKVAKADVVSSWQSTPDNSHVPSEKLVKDTIGNLTPADVGAATAEQGAKADSAIQGVSVNGTEIAPDSGRKVDLSVPTASTSTPSMDGSASTGSEPQWARGDHVHPTDTTREALANKKHSVDPTSTTDYLSAKAVADYVNSSVATNTANFLGSFKLTDLGLTYPATDVQIAAALNSHTWPTGVTPTNNDYVYVEIQDPQTTSVDDRVERFKFSDTLASWGYEYALNNSSFTAAEIAAIDSGITAADKNAYDAHVADGNIHVTAANKTAWNGKQDAISDLSTIRSGASAGATALQPGGDGSNLTVSPDGTSTGTDIGSSTTLKAWAQKFKNLVASLSNYVPTSRKINNKALSSDVTLSASDVGAATSGHTHPLSIASGGSGATALTANTTYTLTAGGKTLAFTTPGDTNTHRPIQMNGSEILGNNTTPLNLKAGSNVSLSNSSGTVTINATDSTYPLAIKSITRSGTTFTATRYDGTTFTFTQQDNNTTYSAGLGISLSGTTFSNSGVRSISVSDVSRLTINTDGTPSIYHPLAVSHGRFVVSHSATYSYTVTGSIFSLTTTLIPDGSTIDFSSFWNYLANPAVLHSVIIVASDSSSESRVLKLGILSLLGKQGQFVMLTVVNTRSANELAEFCWDNNKSSSFTVTTYTGTYNSVKENQWTVGAGKSRTFFITRLVGSTSFSITATS